MTCSNTSLYKENENNPLLFKGSQDENNGRFEIQICNLAVDKLRSTYHPGVNFNYVNTNFNYIFGGCCSAMSLNYLEKISQINRVVHNQNYLNSKQVLAEIKNYGLAHLNKCDETMRAQQSALNTIDISELPKYIDRLPAKVSALLSFKNFQIEEIIFNDDLNERTKPKFLNEIKNICLGHFIIRAIKEDIGNKNNKDEEYGHTMILSHLKEVKIFYNPNEGAFRLDKSNFETDLFSRLKIINHQNTTPKTLVARVGIIRT